MVKIVILPSKEELEKLYYKDKLNLKQISELFNCDKSTVGNKFKKLGIKLRSHSESMVGKMSGKNHPMYGVHRMGKDNPNWKGGYENKLPTCCDCGKKLSACDAIRCKKCEDRFKIGIKFPLTAHKNMSEAQIKRWGNPDSTVDLELIKEKRAATLAKHIADGTVKPKMFNTKPELMRLAQQIKNGFVEGKTIIKQKFIKGIGMVDFYYPETNTLEFIDGDFWHCNPNVDKYKCPAYFQPMLKMFAYEVRKRDKQITEKAISLGYTVIRIWERDVYKINLEDYLITV